MTIARQSTRAIRCENLPNGSGFFKIVTLKTEMKVIRHIISKTAIFASKSY